jgi:hypothetical protein
MTGRICEGGDDAATVRALAEAFGAPLRPEHIEEAAAAWRLMKPHLARVRAAELAPDEETASFFRP